MNLCKCGCGKLTKTSWVNGHNRRTYKYLPRIKLICQCGCGEEIEWCNRFHSEYPKYKVGHNLRVDNPMTYDIVKNKVGKKIKAKWKDPEYRKNLIKAHTGYTVTHEARMKMSKAHKGKKFSDAHRSKISANMMGEGNHQWKDGVYTDKNYCSNWRYIGGLVLEEDGRYCHNPYCLGISTRIVPHHIDEDKTNCNMNNIIPVCNSCNGKASTGRTPLRKKYLYRLLKRIRKYGWDPLVMFE